MKLPPASFSLLLAVALSNIGSSAVQAQSPPAATSPPSESGQIIKGWGEAIIPDAECKVQKDDQGDLTIELPDNQKPYDLAAEVGSTNAPHVVQKIEGDFTLTVKVHPVKAPGEKSTNPVRVGYHGAAIIVMKDTSNIVTLARAVLERGKNEPQPYTNFEVRINASVDRLGDTEDLPITMDGPLYLRLERRDDTIHGSASTDGVDWKFLNSKEIPDSWSKELKAGVTAISTSEHGFSPKFSELTLSKD